MMWWLLKSAACGLVQSDALLTASRSYAFAYRSPRKTLPKATTRHSRRSTNLFDVCSFLQTLPRMLSAEKFGAILFPLQGLRNTTANVIAGKMQDREH